MLKSGPYTRIDNISFLCGLFPNEMRDSIERKSKGNIQYAADALQWSIVKGLDLYFDSIQLINLPYIGSYPFRYKDAYFKNFHFSHTKGADDINVGFNNITLYKFFSRYINAKKYLRIWSNNCQHNKLILIYAVHTPFIKAAIEIKEQYNNVKICLIVPDLPKFMCGNNNILYKIMRKYQDYLLKQYLNKIDAFVLLSKHMVEPLRIGSRPWICVEGIYDNKLITYNQSDKPLNKKIILYSGMITSRYGILNLMDAFSMIEDENYSLWICGDGDGDAKDEIKRRMNSDSRIKYYGQVPREKVLSLQKQATVLINPRTSEGEFTKYSFPSKIMEYFASGTPTIMHRLPGIPEEYFNYCFVADREDAKGLYDTIKTACGMNQADLEDVGRKAQNFILENKNIKNQACKIFEMIKNLYY